MPANQSIGLDDRQSIAPFKDPGELDHFKTRVFPPKSPLRVASFLDALQREKS